MLAQADALSARRPRAYLLGIIRNTVRRYEERNLRSNCAPRPSREWLEEVDALGGDISQHPTGERLHALVLKALDLMERRARGEGQQALLRVETLKLRILSGRPNQETAQILGLTQKDASYHYHLGLLEFRAALRELLRGEDWQ